MGFLADIPFASYWSAPEVTVNLVVFMNIVGALLLGMVVGYERTYHGRAAGMRTYGLVCMASAALTVLAGYPGYWYAGHAALAPAGVDPTRIIQGIVTGIGFLGAGMIMKDGLNISGLTTAASLWASSVIGVLVGLGFYPSAILLTVLSAVSMLWLSKVEAWLPSHPSLSVSIRFRPGFVPNETFIRHRARDQGYAIVNGSLTIASTDGRLEWHFVVIEMRPEKGKKGRGEPLARIADQLGTIEGVESFQLSHARN